MLRNWHVANLFRAGALVAVCAAASSLPGQTFTKLLDFGAGSTGFDPRAALIQGFDGALYGTTDGGGTYNHGTIFRVSEGRATTLHSFNGNDGRAIYAPLARSRDGKLYGVTYYGGVYGWGSVYTITPDGAFATVYSFCAEWNCQDGMLPFTGVIVSNSGDLYGTTQYGGSSTIQDGGGTIFRLTSSGILTTLYNFCTPYPCTTGEQPRVPLVQAASGIFYGSAPGWLFSISSTGIFHSFGYLPSGIGEGTSELVQAPDGNLYGTTNLSNDSLGSVFRLTPSGEITAICSFSAQSGYNIEVSNAGLVVGSDGNLYGTTNSGGANGQGTIFKVSLSGELTTLYNFCSAPRCTDGAAPVSALVQATNGIFYGTTPVGPGNGGTLFSLSVGLDPFVELQPSAAKAGAVVTIFGQNLDGTTRVWFKDIAGSLHPIDHKCQLINTKVGKLEWILVIVAMECS